MKKAYIIPEIEIIETLQEQSLLVASDPSSRAVEGGATTGDGVPTDISETGDTPDPFGGHGQDGNSTRAPGFFGDF